MEPSVTLGRRLYLAQRAQHDVLDARLAAHGASVWNWVLLRSATELDGGSQRELADHMGIEPPTLVGHLDKLVDEGLVERRRDERDRRVVRVHATAAGRTRLAQLHDVVMGVDAEMRVGLSAREVAVVDRALARIHERLSQMKGEMKSEMKEEEARDGRRP